MRKAMLDNGVRVVMERMSALRSVAIGLWINVGTRDEAKGQEGLSHFLEHMMFKGTRRRSASQISKEIDSLGGEMNAFTTHESTVFSIWERDSTCDRARWPCLMNDRRGPFLCTVLQCLPRLYSALEGRL